MPYRRAALLAAGAALLGAGCPRPPLPPNELPTAVLVAPAEVDAGALADFDASMSSDPDGRLVEYWFNFGDGTPRLTTSDPRTVHGYAQPGVYGVALTVIDDRGGRSDTFGEIVVTGEILPPPPQCFDDSDCDAADVCVDGACQPVTPGCDGPEDCAPGEICMDGTCVPSSGFLPCVREADCAPGEACQLIVVGVGLFATECRPEQAGGAALGEPCAVPTSAIGCATPPSGPTFCRTGLCVAGTCTQICEALADCPSAYQCIDLRKIALGDVGAFHGCVSDPVVDTDSATVAALALGFFAPSPPFIVAPPLDAVSMTLVTSDIGSDRTVTLFDLTAPSGLVLWDLIGFAGGFPQPLLQLPLWEVSTALLPNTPSLQLCPGGDYTARFTADMAVDGVALNRIFKTADGPVGGGRLDLNLFFVGTMADPNAATAPGDSAFQSELAYAEEILQQAGISLGAVSYFDLTGPQADALQIINSVVGPTAELADLLALSSAAPNGALNVFFVSMIDDPMAAGTIGGVSGGIPGPPGFAGSTHSGIALSLAPFPTFTGALGQELAHETAHYLGLFHTTEPDGTTFESIPDTPVCDVSFDANGDGVLLASECGAAGATNLMFWAQSTPYNIEVTPGQGFVLVRHPDVGGL